MPPGRLARPGRSSGKHCCAMVSCAVERGAAATVPGRRCHDRRGATRRPCRLWSCTDRRAAPRGHAHQPTASHGPPNGHRGRGAGPGHESLPAAPPERVWDFGAGRAPAQRVGVRAAGLNQAISSHGGMSRARSVGRAGRRFSHTHVLRDLSDPGRETAAGALRVTAARSAHRPASPSSSPRTSPRRTHPGTSSRKTTSSEEAPSASQALEHIAPTPVAGIDDPSPWARPAPRLVAPARSAIEMCSIASRGTPAPSPG